MKKPAVHKFNSKANIKKILAELSILYPNPKTELYFETSFQLLIATMLSAQTTDRQVNNITRKLFVKYATPADFACLSPEEVEKYIKSCGLYKNKAKNIVATSKQLIEKHNSQVPDTMDELVALPGVGRKTANVVLANAFDKPAIAVDTHVFRVSNRLGLAASQTPEKTEEDLKINIPISDWNEAHHWLIFHGRYICKARNLLCEECTLKPYCQFFKTGAKIIGK